MSKEAKGSKSDFCRRFEFGWSLNLRWFDLVGLLRLRDDRVVKIELATNGTHETYVGLRCQIINTREGVIDQKFFAFDDYLDTSAVGRADDRVSGPHRYPSADEPCRYMVVAHCGWDWYIAKPKTTRPLCDAIEHYVDFFR